MPKAPLLMPGRDPDSIRRQRQPLAEDGGKADEAGQAAQLVIANEFQDLAVRLVATPLEGDPLVLLLAPGQSDAFDVQPGTWTFRREAWRVAQDAPVPVVDDFPEQRIEPRRRYVIALDEPTEGALRRLVDSPLRN